MRIAIDSGGTFTDCVYLKDGFPAVVKVLSTPHDPASSVLEAIRRTWREGPAEVRHGTTIGTNALLERKGARVAFVTTAGFEDSIAIGRQTRSDLYNWRATPKPCLVPPELRFGVSERVTAEGEILLSPGQQELDELRRQIRAARAETIAVSLLFAFENPENERRVASTLKQLGLPISVAHEILPEFREYERSTTVVVNAYLTPKAGRYVESLESEIERNSGALYVMQSSGGIIPAKLATQEPVRTVLSGPAGGVMGAHRVAQLAGFENLIAFDMGGTSTDVTLIDSQGPKTTNESRVSEIPIAVPMLDIHTVGAGGGSLAWFDRGGVLHVGPMSAGADPGPISYGRGEQPTVTDANLVLGRLDADLPLAGSVRLDELRTHEFMEKTRGPLPTVEEFAAGILRLTETEMERAIRVISIERGHDPREFTLVSFGGAGPLHACSLARALGIPRVLVPAMPGALSALGILMSDVVRDYSRTVMITTGRSPDDMKSSGSTPTLDSLLEPHFAELEKTARGDFKKDGMSGFPTRSIDLRYAGQGYELNVEAGPQALESFHRAHRKRYGHADENRRVEVVNIRVRMIAPASTLALPSRTGVQRDPSRALMKKKRVMLGRQWLETAVFDRDRLECGNRLEGPAIVHEYSATTVVPPGSRVEVDNYLNLLIAI